MEIAKDQTAQPMVKLDIAEERLPAPLQHPSGKRRLMPLLVHLMPEHEIYCEPFCGMACVFFGKPPSRKEILNDLDPDYAIVLKFLRDATESDWEHLKAKNWRPSRNQFEELAESKPTSDLDKVYRAMYLMRLGYRGHKGKGNYSPAEAERVGSGIPPLLYARRQEYKARLQSVIITSQDFQKSMQSHDSANTLFYLDPPYVSGPGSGPQHYLGATEEESRAIFQRLLKTVQGIKGKWIMTHSENPKIADVLERNGNLRNVRVKEPTEFEGERASRIEMIAANFKLPHRLQIRYLRKGIPIMSLEMSEDGDEISRIQKIPVKEINPSSLRHEDDKQILNLHLRMHQLWGSLGEKNSLMERHAKISRTPTTS